MSDEEPGTEKVNVVFRRAPGYRHIAATGAWGAASPNGEIVFDFYIEYPDVPEELVLEIERGKMKAEERKGKRKTIRELQLGVVLRADIAYSIGTFLRERAEMVGFKPPKENK